MPPEIQMKALEMVKNRGRLARDAKKLVSYSPIGHEGTVGVWETDSAETLFPMLNALSSVGVDTEIPHCESETAMKRWEEGINEERVSTKIPFS